MKIPLRGANVRITHERLNGSEVIPVVQEGSGEGMPHDVRVNPLLDRSLFYHRFDEAVNGLGGQVPFFVGTMLPQGLKKGMSNISPNPVSF